MHGIAWGLLLMLLSLRPWPGVLAVSLQPSLSISTALLISAGRLLLRRNSSASSSHFQMHKFLLLVLVLLLLLLAG